MIPLFHLMSTLDEYSRLLSSPFSPPFLSFWLSQPDAGVQEPDATVDDDYYTGGAYYYVQPADDDQE